MQLMVCVYKQYIIQENNRLFRKPPLLGPPLSLAELRILKSRHGEVSCGAVVKVSNVIYTTENHTYPPINTNSIESTTGVLYSK